jgi:hypothetical protein
MRRALGQLSLADGLVDAGRNRSVHQEPPKLAVAAFGNAEQPRHSPVLC